MKDTKNCDTCFYYRNHYVKLEDTYCVINDGHCVFPKLKRRYADQPACSYYKQQSQEVTEKSSKSIQIKFTIDIPGDLEKEIERLCTEWGCTRNELFHLALEHGLYHGD